ncbi:hypothetical protein ABH920_008980 [Catenulispora sp. EB89]|uniref:hypothetical protein n=1 Tax=Catenulispora sp. EB89 TaxID=3156257 RepID=UPI00351721C3
MKPSAPALAGLVLVVALLIGLALVHVRRYTVSRPPIGLFVRSDVAVMAVSVVIAPLLYLELPATVVAAVFGLVTVVAIQTAAAPLLGGRPATLAALALCAATWACWLSGHPLPTTLLTDAGLAVAVIGVTGMWVQGGMRAAHVAAFAALLTGYDLIATSLTSLMTRFSDHLHGLPFAPLLVIPGSHGALVAIGLGDLVMLVLFPMAAGKAFGRRPAVTAGALGVAVTALIMALFWWRVVSTAVPVLAFLGPLIVAQYVVWRRLGYRERTVREWRGAMDPRAVEPDPNAPLRAALGAHVPAHLAAGAWVAVDGGLVVGIGPSPGLASRDARANGHVGSLVVRGAKV